MLDEKSDFQQLERIGHLHRQAKVDIGKTCMKGAIEEEIDMSFPVHSVLPDVGTARFNTVESVGMIYHLVRNRDAFIRGYVRVRLHWRRRTSSGKLMESTVSYGRFKEDVSEDEERAFLRSVLPEFNHVDGLYCAVDTRPDLLPPADCDSRIDDRFEILREELFLFL